MSDDCVKSVKITMEEQEVIKMIEKSAENSTDGRLFCPLPVCGHRERKFFLQRKHLKQHLLKVHVTRKFKCDQCKKAFSTQNFLLAHERQCGREFKCLQCEWIFKSREALLTHARRKGHKFEESAEVKPTRDVKLLPRESPRKSDQVHQSVQTRVCGQPEKRKLTQTTQTCTESPKKAKLEPKSPPGSPKVTDNSSQTPEQPFGGMSDFFDDSLSIFPGHFDGSLCSTETQTEARLSYSHSRSTGSDPLLYSHMYTQTCDEILSELGLSDVQTQTTWPPSDFQDFLVSTETQTSFTQCLEEEMASFTTTHTQT